MRRQTILRHEQMKGLVPGQTRVAVVNVIEGPNGPTSGESGIIIPDAVVQEIADGDDCILVAIVEGEFTRWHLGTMPLEKARSEIARLGFDLYVQGSPIAFWLPDTRRVQLSLLELREYCHLSAHNDLADLSRNDADICKAIGFLVAANPWIADHLSDIRSLTLYIPDTVTGPVQAAILWIRHPYGAHRLHTDKDGKIALPKPFGTFEGVPDGN